MAKAKSKKEKVVNAVRYILVRENTAYSEVFTSLEEVKEKLFDLRNWEEGYDYEFDIDEYYLLKIDLKNKLKIEYIKEDFIIK